jgi:hypothetical protein
MTLAEAFYLLSRALGELATPVAHEALRARMAALHGSEDPLLEPARFPRLLRQANDAEIADVRLLGEDDYEVSPHKSDLAMKVHAAPEPGANGEVLTPTRPAGALRFRSGTVTGRPASAVPMVGVVSLGGASKPAAEPAPALKQETAKPAAAARPRAAARKAAKKAVKTTKAAKPKTAPAAKNTKAATAKTATGKKSVENSKGVAQPKSAKVVKKAATTTKAKKG